jgi:hypothetical protein
MKMNRVFMILSMVAILMVADGCRKGPSQSKRNTTKIKKGKPMPCPLKDC